MALVSSGRLEAEAVVNGPKLLPGDLAIARNRLSTVGNDELVMAALQLMALLHRRHPGGAGGH